MQNAVPVYLMETSNPKIVSNCDGVKEWGVSFLTLQRKFFLDDTIGTILNAFSRNTHKGYSSHLGPYYNLRQIHKHTYAANLWIPISST